jgi:hypothetical protein
LFEDVLFWFGPLFWKEHVENYGPFENPAMDEREPNLFELEFDEFIATLARLFAHEGDAAAVSALSEGTNCCDYVGEDWDVGHNDLFEVRLIVPQSVFNAIANRLFSLERELHTKAKLLMGAYPGASLQGFKITPKYVNDPEWRTGAKAWLRGEGVNNQGRVRSSNIAPYSKDGLLFRSKPEINLYEALKTRAITFAPLPVFLRGGDNCRRIEPDFVIFQSGKVIVIEIDGPFHTESPAKAHERTTMFQWEGAHIERITASECDTPE